MRDISVPATMAAVLLTGHGGLDKLEYREDVPVPTPGPNDVLVRVGACGINNTDLNTRTGWYDASVRSGLTAELAQEGLPPSSDVASWDRASLSFPRIQGAAIVGTVVAAGPGVDEARVGARVMVDPVVRDRALPEYSQGVAYIGSERDGGYAQYAVVPSANAYEVRSELSDAELATFPCAYATAEEMLARARLAAGETVLITGASGGVGSANVQLARLRGATVIAVVGAGKEERVRELGAAHVIRRDVPSLADAVTEIVGERGVHVVADVAGGPHFGELLRVLARAGRYTTGGAIAGPMAEIDLRDLIYKDLEMYGIANPTEQTFLNVLAHVESGALKPLLERTYPLKDLRRAQEDFIAKTHVGKLAVVPPA